MLLDRLSEDEFDRTLRQALQKHIEPVQPGFTERMLTRIRLAEEQRILARVILQERLILVGSIIFGIAAVIVLVVFPSAIESVFQSIGIALNRHVEAVFRGISISIQTVAGEWQLYLGLGLVFIFAIFCLFDLLFGDRLKIA
jgi:hypothetical protein